MGNQHKQCLVCRKPSNGMHFGALSCRACAAFFRRATVLNIKYECKNGDSNCNIEGRGRFICRYCRYTRCYEIGMQAEKVQRDYDPTYSIKGLCDDLGSEESGSSPRNNIDEPSTSRKNSDETDFLFNFSPKPSDKPIVRIDFSEVTRRIEELFREALPGSEEGLLIGPIVTLRKDQKSKEEVRVVEKLEISETIDWLSERILKWARWFATCKILMSLEQDQKIQVFRSSWNVLHTFERLEMSSKILENDKSLLISDELVWLCEQSHFDVMSISEVTNQYFSNLFDPYLHRYIDEVGKQLKELQLTDQELTFCLVHLLGIDVTDLNAKTLEILEALKQELAEQMHKYYSENSDMTKYSHRLIKLMNIVNTVRKISIQKNRVKELFYIFDVFHADISDPYFFEIF